MNTYNFQLTIWEVQQCNDVSVGLLLIGLEEQVVVLHSCLTLRAISEVEGLRAPTHPKEIYWCNTCVKQ